MQGDEKTTNVGHGYFWSAAAEGKQFALSSVVCKQVAEVESIL